jgi:hypothetical protein
VRSSTRSTVDLMVLMMAVLSGMAVAILAMMGSEGWPELRGMAVAVVAAPLGALAFCYRERRAMILLARGVTVVNLLTDVTIALLTWRRGGPAELNVVPVVICLALAALWQGLAAAAVRRPPPARS